MTPAKPPLSEKLFSPLPPANLDLVGILDYRAQQQPEQLAYQFLRRGEQVEQQLTYRQLKAKASAIAQALRESLQSENLQTRETHRALLLFSPGLDFVAAFLGCLCAGVTAVPAYPPRKNNKILRLQAIVQDAEASAVLTTTALSDKISPWFEANSPLANVQWISVDAIEEEEEEEEKADQISDFTTNPLAFLQYTSGSTGTPKGVMVSQNNIVHNLKAIHRCFEHTPNSHGVIWLPPYHDMGLIGGILQPLYGGFPVTLMSPIDFLQKPLRWLRAISTHGGTTSGGPDFAYRLCATKAQALLKKESSPQSLADLDLSTWKVAFTGAEPIRADTLALFSDVFEPYGFSKKAFYPCYGMAETTLIISGGAVNQPPVVEALNPESLSRRKVQFADFKKPTEKMTSAVGCGHGLADQQLEIVNPQTQRRCAPGEIGEIWVRGESVTQGYWKNTEETLRTYRAYLCDTGEGPFLRTGDLGFIGCAQNPNELFITGRIKDVMIIRGRNYYPQDIEQTVEDCHPAVRAGAIASFTTEENGEQKLVVVTEIKRTFVRQLDVSSVSSRIRQAIAAQHDLQVHTVLLVKPGSIPKTSSGKIQRYLCRQYLMSGELSVVKDWSQDTRHKHDFVKLQSDVESVYQKIEVRVTERATESDTAEVASASQRNRAKDKSNVNHREKATNTRNNSSQRVSL